MYSEGPGSAHSSLPPSFLSFFICRLPSRLVYHVFFLNALHYRSRLGTLRCSFLLQIDSPTLRLPIRLPPFVADCLYNCHFRLPPWRACCVRNFAPAHSPALQFLLLRHCIRSLQQFTPNNYRVLCRCMLDHNAIHSFC